MVGVRAAFCSDPGLLNGITFANFRLKDGSQHSIGMTVMESGVFDLYELKPVAGKFSVGDEDAAPQNSSQYVINESAIARLGFASPAAAIGQPIAIREGDGSDDIGEVIGVVPDFSLGSVEQRIKPSVYRVTRDSHGNGLISAKLTGAHIPDTLAAIDKLWRRTGASEPIDRFFLNEYLQNLYLVVLRQAQMFAIFSGVALLLAGVGMVGLAVSATQRRTKEIGIRKAMGAGVNEVMRLLLWQFAKPVLWATLIAWPVAAFVMNRWLQGFAYHIDLEPWIFVASSVLALVIALVTVSAHCYLVAREKPVHALRYE